ncbi:hypothetical protein TNIN_123501 [Trichonephila inaurata madagascariensis]|uniref:Uncharacterized protein n=1 Tax=Trichonephila inaurata madagascariensis TaxID=2747483 RepID=A0A8X6XFI9_9ARAC|nr:hypothetical protein TNIN_123501 [Trichonephila inaurata madagascariensis]
MVLKSVLMESSHRSLGSPLVLLPIEFLRKVQDQTILCIPIMGQGHSTISFLHRNQNGISQRNGGGGVHPDYRYL